MDTNAVSSRPSTHFRTWILMYFITSRKRALRAIHGHGHGWESAFAGASRIGGVATVLTPAKRLPHICQGATAVLLTAARGTSKSQVQTAQ